MIKKLLKIDYRHYICFVITLLFLCLAIFHFKFSHLRIIESLRDFGYSFVYYFIELLELDIEFKVTVNEFTNQSFVLPLDLPGEWDEFKALFVDYVESLFTWENFLRYLKSITDFLYYFAKISTLLLPLIVCLIVLNTFSKTNNDYNKDSNYLIFYKKIENKVFIPVKSWIHNFILFVKENKNYLKLWAFIWCFNFCFITIIIEFFAYYMYFVASFDFISLYRQVLKLLIDLAPMINFIPLIGWIIIGLFLFHQLRKKRGYDYLQHMEMRNRGVINERPIVLMLWGTMGSKKTTIITDIALSEECILRDKAFELILKNDMKFPYFPWINFENALKKAIKCHAIFNLATAKRFVASKKKNFLLNPVRKKIFNYDYVKYGYFYNDQLEIVDIWDVLENYAQLYFIYVIQSSLLISNYSIRSDNVLSDLGNFPMWNTDFFKKDPLFQEAYSRHAHILDFDMLRLGKKIIDNNEKANAFEFGVINITEIGKERGNNLELQQLKKTDLTTNQKNDLFNSWLKMVRHSATVDNYPFVKVITDDQRPESWGADARDLTEVIHVTSCSNSNLAIPFFEAEDLFIEWIFDKFRSSYYKHRYERGDNTLFIYLYKKIISILYNYQKRIYNTFGYYDMKLDVEQGTLDTKAIERKYYLMFKKIYSKRFSTDCFNEFFNKKALASNIGLDDLEEFKTEKASFNEMMKENSYFFNELIDLSDNIKITEENRVAPPKGDDFIYE